MAARRRSSSARGTRRSPSPARVSASAGAAARASRSREARGGSSTIPCPACGTEYRIAVELLDDQIKCQSCGRTFIPSKSSRRGLQKKNPATPFLMGGGILLALILLFWFASSGGGEQTNKRPAQPVISGPELGDRNPRVRDVLDWHAALSSGDRLTLATLLEREGLRKFLGITDIDGTTEDVEQRVLDALLSGEQARKLRDTRATSGRISSAAAEADAGQVELSLAIRDDKSADYVRGGAEVFARFKRSGDRFRVVGWEWSREPALKGRAALDAMGIARKSVHEVIGKADDVQRTIQGKTQVMREAELKPLGHLDDTPAAVREKIDAMITQLVDLEAGGQFANRAILELSKIGKPAVPRLLNKLYETPIDTREDRYRVRRVTGALEKLTGQRFGFDPSSITDISDELRASSLKQWYGWWADNHWREKFDYAIDKRDGPELLELKQEGEPESPPRRDSPIR